MSGVVGNRELLAFTAVLKTNRLPTEYPSNVFFQGRFVGLAKRGNFENAVLFLMIVLFPIGARLVGLGGAPRQFLVSVAVELEVRSDGVASETLAGKRCKNELVPRASIDNFSARL